MVPSFTLKLAAVAFSLASLAQAAPPVSGTVEMEKRAASCTFPSPPKTSSLSAARTIAKGKSFDGGNVRFDRGKGACSGQKEGGNKDAVFLLEEGATLSNVVIGADQAEGVHCLGACTLKNVWFEKVCEDAITIKYTGTGTSTITGGGAKSASDKVIQHNGAGTVKVDSFCVQDFGKLYRSCGNCSTQYKRAVTFSNIIAKNGKLMAGVNSNYGDTATFGSNIAVSSVKSMCDTFQGTNDNSKEPTKLTTNKANTACKF